MTPELRAHLVRAGWLMAGLAVWVTVCILADVYTPGNFMFLGPSGLMIAYTHEFDQAWARYEKQQRDAGER